MTLQITPGSLTCTDTDGHTVLSTAEKMWYARGVDYISGSLTLPTRNTGTTATSTYTLGTAHSSATFVRGAMKVSSYSSTGLQYTGIDAGIWVNVAGTFVMAYTIIVMHTLTFQNSGGTVQLVEQFGSALQNNAFGQTYQVGGSTIEYRLICGQFT